MPNVWGSAPPRGNGRRGDPGTEAPNILAGRVRKHARVPHAGRRTAFQRGAGLFLGPQRALTLVKANHLMLVTAKKKKRN